MSRELGPIIKRTTILSRFKFQFQQEMISQSNSKFDINKNFNLLFGYPPKNSKPKCECTQYTKLVKSGLHQCWTIF